MLKRHSFIYCPQLHKVISIRRHFIQLHDNSEPHMKIACFGGVGLEKRGFFNSHRFPAVSSWILYCHTYQ